MADSRTPLVVAGIALALAGASCTPARTDLAYEVRVPADSASRNRLTVSISCEPAETDSLVLDGLASATAMAIDTLVAWGPDGSLLPIKHALIRRGTGKTALELPRFVVSGPLPTEVHVRYRVQLGVAEQSAELLPTGRCFGVGTPTYCAFAGRNVFLSPQGAVGRIEVRFRMPRGWRVYAPWKSRGAVFQPGLPGGSAVEHLITAFIGLGHFHEDTATVGRTALRYAYPEVGSQADGERGFARLCQAATYVTDALRLRLGPSYLIIALPRAPNGEEVTGEDWASGSGGTLLPLTPNRLHFASVGLIAAGLRSEPFRPVLLPPDEYWLLDGVEQWLAARAVAHVFGGSPAEVQQSFATRYLGTFGGQGLDRNLELLYSRAGNRITARESLAPTMLACIDHDLEQQGMAGGLDRALQQRFAPSNRHSIWDLLPPQSAFRRAFSRDSLIRGLRPLPTQAFYAPRPLQLRPTPPARPAVDTLWLAFTGRNEGFLENCGCKVNQAGGVARRATAIARFRRAHPHALLLDAGDGFILPQNRAVLDPFERAEQGLVASAMAAMHYQGEAVATTELALGPSSFRALGHQLPYLAANLSSAAGGLAPPSVHLRRGARSVLVVGAFDPPPLGRGPPLYEESAESLVIADPVESVRRALRDRRPGELAIVIGRLSPLTIRRLIAAEPDIDVVLTSDVDTPIGIGARGTRLLPIHDVPGFFGRTLVLETHSTRYGLGTAGLAFDRDGHIAGAVLNDVWLSDSIPDDQSVRSLLTRFYDRVGRQQAMQAAVPALFANDELRQRGVYAGAEACAACHRPEYIQWLETPHAGAYKTLLQKHRHFQPRCVSCHVVGYGTSHGYRLGQPDEHLANVGCEICHGPGADHARAPSRANIRRVVEERVCLECHTREHSDHFVFAERLPRVRHDAPLLGAGTGAAGHAGSGGS
jgi:hypothetical protein